LGLRADGSRGHGCPRSVEAGRETSSTEMTRFHMTLVVGVVLIALFLVWGSATGVIAVTILFFIGMGLGVAVPRLRFFGPFICHGDARRTRPAVALTFDDGPDARSTPALLDVLRQENVRAAFFCIGRRVETSPDVAQRIVREGHLLENHSHFHSNVTNFYTVGSLKTELARAQAAIVSATGTLPGMFRPPIGLSNPNIFRAARALGLKVIGWSVRSLDTRITDPRRVVARILRGLKPGAIILLHDGNIPVERLIPTVKELLEALRERGYEVVRLDELLIEK
jgi:peptidoglycan-N-acetylglucosamine deacetylase